MCRQREQNKHHNCYTGKCTVLTPLLNVLHTHTHTHTHTHILFERRRSFESQGIASIRQVLPIDRIQQSSCDRAQPLCMAQLAWRASQAAPP